MLGDDMNNKGFTLVELLATLAILAVLMLLAVPNVIGVVNKSKNKTYVEGAKKLVTLAEYKIRSKPNLKPLSGQSYCFYKRYLDKSQEVGEAPNNKSYLIDRSYVKVTNNSGKIEYRVQLAELVSDNVHTGVEETDSNNLYKDNVYELIKTSIPKTSKCSCSGACYFTETDTPSSTPKI